MPDHTPRQPIVQLADAVGGPWRTQRHLLCRTATTCAAPSMPTASFLWRYGRITRPA